MSDRADATLVGECVQLRPITPDDYGLLYRLETGSAINFRWRLGGHTVRPEDFADSLWRGVSVSFLACSTRPDSEGIALLTAYGADDRHGFCSVACARLRSFGGAFLDALSTSEALVLFIDYLFQGWPYRKLYIECPEYNQDQIQSFLSLCHMEGLLREHLFLDGRHWDLGTWSIWRDSWPEVRTALIRRR